jgi:hypothetical protein
MNTDKEREQLLTKDNNNQEQRALGNLNSVDPGFLFPISFIFSSSVFICVHPWLQTAFPCA